MKKKIDVCLVFCVLEFFETRKKTAKQQKSKINCHHKRNKIK